MRGHKTITMIFEAENNLALKPMVIGYKWEGNRKKINVNLCKSGSFINEVHLWKMENNVSCLLGEIGILLTSLLLPVLTNVTDTKRKLTK